MNDNTKHLKKRIWTIIISVFLALFLTVTELAAKKYGLELRTFTQVIKGTYLWLVMPCLILFSGNAILKLLQEKDVQNAEQQKISRILNRLRSIVVVIFFFVILLISFLRGVFYVFSDELITEEVTPDGYIQGMYSSFLSESYYSYYVPTAVFFRKPFPGWTADELTAKIKEECSPDIEFVEKQKHGWYVFRIADSLAKGDYIYFHASDSYMLTHNFFSQVLLSEASRFWSTRNRYVTLSDDGTAFADVIDTGEEITTETLPYFDALYITCYDSQDDIAACAADITDWLQFVKNTGQFPYDTHPQASRLLSSIYIGNGGNYLHLDITPLYNFTNDNSWEDKYQQMEEAITQVFEEHHAWIEQQQSYRQNETETVTNTDTADALFMESYDGYYEKECPVGDGTIRYRMVVRDAALGSRLYSLLKSTDSGETWQMSSSDPFAGQMGMGIDFTFLDEEFGFATLTHNGGDEADLYVTEDGGNTYQFVVIEGFTATLDNGYTYTPYDYPQMPYEEEGILYVLCGQGADGDYNGGDNAGLALYQSTDGGHTFTYVKIQPPPVND